MKKVLLGVFLCIFAFSTTVKADAPSEELPLHIRTFCEAAGERYNICPELLESIAYHESRFSSTAENGNCVGVMQIDVKAHKERIESHGWTQADMKKPYRNIVVAADYLSELYEEYEDSAVVLAMYSGNSKAIKNGNLCEYAEKVLNRSCEYERLHGK